MKRYYFLCALCALLVLNGCMKQDLYQGPQEEEKEYNGFDFSTVSATSLEVNYLTTGVHAAVYFELYDENPLTETEDGYAKRDDLSPLFAAYTNDEGVYKGNIDLPAYLTKAYIYTPVFFARTLLEADVVNGMITATDADVEEATTRSVASTTNAYYSYLTEDGSQFSGGIPNEYKDKRWKKWLGEYDTMRGGEVGYKYGGGNLSITNSADIYANHAQIFDVNKPCPTEYRSYADITVSEEAELAVTFMGGNTCWSSALGYYYYMDGQKPASLDEANVIMLFPNTQDGEYGVNRPASQEVAGIERGTAVQLMYYPNIASDSQAGATKTFPANCKVGFVLAVNGWSNRIANFNGHKRKRSTTSEGLNIDKNGNAFKEPQTAKYTFDQQLTISFEDDNDHDQNFSDVIIAMRSNPVKAITGGDIPTVDPDNKTTSNVIKGIYAFEDLWPNAGDYDMNDVMLRYNYEKVFDKDNNIYSESFIFKTFQNYASNRNGLAFKVNGSTTPSSIEYAIRKSGEDKFVKTDFTHEAGENVFLLTDNVKENMGAEYKVTFTYASPITGESAVQPFIYRNTTNGKRWEVHIAKEAPTSLADPSYFSMKGSADASKLSESIYYVRNGIYPFAFFLAGADENDLSKMLDKSNEGKGIDELYSGYDSWVTSEGKSNTDWYNK